MVAYSFAPMFCGPVAAGTKVQTVRGHRKRHARPGEPIQLYAGMRTRQCRKLVDRDPICRDVRNIAIYVAPAAPAARISAIEIDGRMLTDDEIEAFAVADGFGDLLDVASARTRMAAWWLNTHGSGRFSGVVIRWKPAR